MKVQISSSLIFNLLKSIVQKWTEMAKNSTSNKLIKINLTACFVALLN